MLEISSRNNPLIKEIKSLYKKKYRWKNKRYIIEGIKIVQEAICNDVDLRQIVYSEKLFSTIKGKNLFKDIENMRNLVKVPPKLFDEIADTENPQGILGIVDFNEMYFEDILSIDNPSLLFLDELQDPGNIGTIIRTCDAFGIDGILLGEGCGDPYSPKVVRSTMGSIFRVPIYMCDNTMDFLLQIKELGIKIVVTDLDGKPIYDEKFKDSFVCVIGNESRGVSPDIVSIADSRIKIPMPGKAESLNAGVAASIIMYEIMKWRR